MRAMGLAVRWTPGPRVAHHLGSIALAGLLCAACSAAAPRSQATAVPSPVSASPQAESTQAGIHKIQHVIIIMQENRSFDSYFGTYPGADGIPMRDGVPSVCVPDPMRGGCVRPFHDAFDINHGGPHGSGPALADIGGGKMDGFVAQAEHSPAKCVGRFDPACSGGSGWNDVMGYHDAREIPNYWTYARDFVLQDHMFESEASWSLPSHLSMVSGWSARCTRQGDPQSCRPVNRNCSQRFRPRRHHSAPITRGRTSPTSSSSTM
jgi:phospholipase C